MEKQLTMGNLFDQLVQVKTKKKEFLAQMERIVPWDEWLITLACGKEQL